MRRKRRFYVSGMLLLAFCAWTAIVRTVDVRIIGPLDTGVGLSGLNGMVHSLTGVNMCLYTLTDFAGLVPFCVVGGFAALFSDSPPLGTESLLSSSSFPTLRTVLCVVPSSDPPHGAASAGHPSPTPRSPGPRLYGPPLRPHPSQSRTPAHASWSHDLGA